MRDRSSCLTVGFSPGALESGFELIYILSCVFPRKKVRSKDKPHGIKYSLAFIVDGERIIGYDNAESKGDHKHYLDQESSYTFEGIDKLWDDFMGDIERFKRGQL